MSDGLTDTVGVGSAIKGFAWKLLERGGYSAVQMVVQVVMARLLAPEDFGAMAIMLVFVNLGNVVVQSGLNTALIQSSNVDERDYSTVFWMSLAVAAVLYVGVYTSAPLIARYYGLSSFVWPLRLLAVVLLLNALNSVQIAKVTRELEMRKIFTATLGSVTVSAALGIGFAASGMGLWALVAQQIAYQVVNCGVLLVTAGWRPSLVFQLDRARKHFAFGWKLLLSGLMEQAYQSVADLIIGKRFSSSQLGLVSQGKKYPAAVGSMLDGAIQPVMLSAVSRIQEDRAVVKRLVRRALKTSTFVIVPTMTAFACCAPSLVPLLLGEQWGDAVPYMQVYCLVYALLPIHTTNLQALNGMGRSDLFLRLELIKKSYGLVALVFCAFVLNSVELLVASYLVTGVISTFVNAWPNKHVIGYSYGEQIRDISPAFLLSGFAALAAGVVGAAGFGSLTTILLQVITFSSVYLGLSAAVHLEAFTYLLKLVHNLISSRS